MKTIFFVLLIFASGRVLAAPIDLKTGESVTIQPGNTVVTCNPGGDPATPPPPPPPVGTLSAYCLSGQLYITLDTDANSERLQIAMKSATICSNALSYIKPKLGDFTGVKTFMFCNSNDLVTVRASVEQGIGKTETAAANATECQNALN